MMEDSRRIRRLPPYVFAVVNELKSEARRRGEDIIDLGMGNPDLATAPHIVGKLVEAAQNPRNHRYSVSRGVYKLRLALAGWYRRKFGVELDPDNEAIVTIGAKEGLSHLVLAMTGPGDTVLVPTPTYPIHSFAVVIAGGNVRAVPLNAETDFLANVEAALHEAWPKPRLMILSFPHNPTTQAVDLGFFEKVVAFAREHELFVLHDFAYAELVFDGYRAPSILEVEGGRDVAVEFYSLSKTYNMPGWRVGFAAGNSEMIHALGRIKSYLDYGLFTPIQIASIIALNGPQDCVRETVATYRGRRDTLVDGLAQAGWEIEPPKGTMFVWARIPESYRRSGSLEFTKLLLKEAKVAVSPGIGFGEGGDEFIRFALVENTHRIRQAARGIKRVL